MTTASFKVMRYFIAGLLLATLIAILFESCVVDDASNKLPSGQDNSVSMCRHWMQASHCDEVNVR